MLAEMRQAKSGEEEPAPSCFLHRLRRAQTQSASGSAAGLGLRGRPRAALAGNRSVAAGRRQGVGADIRRHAPRARLGPRPTRQPIASTSAKGELVSRTRSAGNSDSSRKYSAVSRGAAQSAWLLRSYETQTRPTWTTENEHNLRSVARLAGAQPMRRHVPRSAATPSRSAVLAVAPVPSVRSLWRGRSLRPCLTAGPARSRWRRSSRPERHDRVIPSIREQQRSGRSRVAARLLRFRDWGSKVSLARL